MQEIENNKTRLEEVQPGELPFQAPILIMGNSTSEATAMCLGVGDQATLSFSAETGELLRVVFGKHNGAKSRGVIDLLLSDWSSEHVNYYRVGCGKLQLKPTLSLLWFVQPHILEELLANAEATERGLTARMLTFDPKIELKHDDGAPRSISGWVQQRWRGHKEYLAKFRPTMCSWEVSCSPEARERFRLFYNQAIDWRMGTYTDVEGELRRWRENTIRIALVLWLADGESGMLTAE